MEPTLQGGNKMLFWPHAKGYSAPAEALGLRPTFPSHLESGDKVSLKRTAMLVSVRPREGVPTGTGNLRRTLPWWKLVHPTEQGP